VTAFTATFLTAALLTGGAFFRRLCWCNLHRRLLDGGLLVTAFYMRELSQQPSGDPDVLARLRQEAPADGSAGPAHLRKTGSIIFYAREGLEKSRADP
jgi:hypothetical protein